MNTIKKEISIDAGHRVPLHGSKCAFFHGHHFVIEAEIKGDLFTSGPQTDMVLDFSFLKALMMENIDATCDHGSILSCTDEKMLRLAANSDSDKYGLLISSIEEAIEIQGFWSGTTEFGKTYVINGAPTAENLSSHWFHILEPKVYELTEGKAFLNSVSVHETPTSVATYTRD